MDYINVVNWEKFQHYKDRDPPWIKLYNSLLDDYEYGCLQDDSKLLLISLFLLAGRNENKIPMDNEWIRKRAMITNEINLDPLLSAGFICVNGEGKKKMIARR